MSTPSSLDHETPLLDNRDATRAEGASLLDREVPPMMRVAQAAFLRDLPQLIGKHRRSWVAYHGNRRIAIGPSKRRLFKKCTAQKLPNDEFIVRLIEVEMPEDFDWNEFRDV